MEENLNILGMKKYLDKWHVILVLLRIMSISNINGVTVQSIRCSSLEYSENKRI